jgi:hypothetical protein
MGVPVGTLVLVGTPVGVEVEVGETTTATVGMAVDVAVGISMGMAVGIVVGIVVGVAVEVAGGSMISSEVVTVGDGVAVAMARPDDNRALTMGGR